MTFNAESRICSPTLAAGQTEVKEAKTRLLKILQAQKGLKDEEKVEFKKLLAEVKYIKAQAQNVTSRLKQVETENKALREAKQSNASSAAEYYKSRR